MTIKSMRTVKHKIKPLAPEQEIQFIDLARAYQFEKNYFSDLFSKFSRKTFKQIDDENIIFNYVNNSFISIQNKLVKSKYQSVNNLQARAWKMALKEAYDLHIRTYAAQVTLIKDIVYRKVYTFYQDLNIDFFKETLEDKDTLNHKDSTDSKIKQENSISNIRIDPLLDFLTYTINYLFYNYSTFKQFEEEFYSKQFYKARVYQRIQPILIKLLDKSIKKEVLTKEQAQQLSQLFKQVECESKQSKNVTESLDSKDPKRTKDFEVKSVETNNLAEASYTAKLTKLLHYYCHCLVKAIRKFRSFNPIQSQINPTITLDGDCYKLYSKYNDDLQKNCWFLDIMSMESGKRIKGLELTGYHHAKKIMKHKKYANLTLSFDPTDMSFYAHFTFESKAAVKANTKLRARVKKRKLKSHKAYVSKANGEAKANANEITNNKLETLTTVGGDFGLTETFTFSDGWVAGRTQKKILKDIADSTKDDVAKIQVNSKENYFGLEKNNPENKRNHINNSFNHNSELNNINTNYRKRQQRYNRYLENYKHQMVNEIINHFTTDNEYGDYSIYSQCSDNKNTEVESLTKLKLVFEDLDYAYTNLGRNKEQKRQINLIKGVLTLLEEKIKLYNLPIEIKYVNPAYTSQTCPNCYYVAKENRDSQNNKFRCCHCGFTAVDDVRYQELTNVIFRW